MAMISMSSNELKSIYGLW